MAGFDTRNALNLAIRALTDSAIKRAAGGWIPPKERERQQRDAMRQEQQQARQAEKEQKEATRAYEKQQKLLSKQFPTQYMPNVGRQVMNTGGVPDQPQRQLSPMGFYSAAAERAQTLQPSGDAVQMINALKNTQGIKTEELQNAGLIDQSGNVHPDWAGRGKVTRDELMSHLQGQMPQIEETVLGGETPRIKELESQLSQMGESDPRYFKLEQELIFEKTNAGTKYKDYTLPGGENYREVLLKLPKNAGPENKEFVVTGRFPSTFSSREEAENYIQSLNRLHEQQPELGVNQYPINIVEQRKAAGQEPEGNFFSQHWDDPNILAHIRMSDRTGPNGEKILHVEELQSDWGQKGKKEGFADTSAQQKLKEMTERFEKLGAERETIRDKVKVYHSKNEITPEGLMDRFLAIGDERSALIGQISEIKSDIRKNVPSAPYVTSTEGWTDLALKRVLKEAAEGGYDKVVWTPGAEQAKRYDLSQQISELELVHNKNGEGKLTFVDKNLVPHQQDVKNPEHLAELVGKDLAEKLYEKSKENNGMARLSGLDLSVGGEGMKGYYDSIVPKRLQNLAKKHDKNARLGYTETHHRGKTSNAPMSYTLPSLDVTPTMRESIMRGQSAYKRGGTVSKKHPALSILGTHIREEEHGEPMFTGRL